MDPDASSDRGDTRPVPYRSRFELLQGSRRDGGGPGLSSMGPADPWAEEGLDWRHYLHVLWQRKLWILMATALGVAAGAGLTRTVEPVYETQSTIWVEPTDEDTGPIEATEIFQGSGWGDLLTSFAVLRPVAEETNLYLDPESRDTPLGEAVTVTDSARSGVYTLSLDSAGTSFVLATESGQTVGRGGAGDIVGEAHGFRLVLGEDLLEPGSSMRFRLSTPTQAAVTLRKNLQVQYNPRVGNLITTHLTWSDPSEARLVHNKVVDTFLDVAADLKSKKLREVVQMLERQTSYAQERLESAELALEQARVENVTLPTESQATPIPGVQSTRGPVFQAYFEKKVQISQLESDVDELNAILEEQRAEGQLDVLRLQSLASISRSSELQASLDELADLEADRRSLLYTYTEQHPRVKEVEDKLRRLREETIPAQLRELASQLRARIETLNQEILAQERELREIPPRHIEEERLRREMQQAEQLHANLLSRLKNAQLAASTSRPNLQVVDRAQEPFAPVNQEGPRLFLLASMAGLGLGVAGALLHDRMDNSVREPEDVERRLGLPVLGLVPRLPSDGGDEAGTRAVLESFRGIRAQLAQTLRPGRATVLVTSPEPRDGKSLVAANLAISFASSRKRTLLMDGDTRRGNAERLFGLDPKPGLTDVLTDGVHLADVLKATDVPNLVLLPHGTLRGFDPDYLDGPEMDRILAELRERFDVIVVDGPPLAAGPDAALLGQRSDQVLLVVRTGVTDRDVAETRLDGLVGFDLPLAGAILNDVPDTAPYYRYYAPYRYYLEEGEVVT